MSETEAIPTKAAAEACETTPRLLRQFLRASKDYEAVGSGGRYAFVAGDLPELKKRFVAWVAERDAAQAAREKAAKEVEAAKATTPTADEDQTEKPAATPTEERVEDDAPRAKPTRARKTTAA